MNPRGATGDLTLTVVSFVGGVCPSSLMLYVCIPVGISLHDEPNEKATFFASGTWMLALRALWRSMPATEVSGDKLKSLTLGRRALGTSVQMQHRCQRGDITCQSVVWYRVVYTSLSLYRAHSRT